MGKVNQKLEKDTLQEALDANVKYNGPVNASKALGMNYSTFMARVMKAKAQGLLPSAQASVGEIKKLQLENKILRDAFRTKENQELSFERIRNEIFKLTSHTPSSPQWKAPKRSKSDGLYGTPTLFCSDWHWGEIVKGGEIGHANNYNMTIARARLKKLWFTAENLLFNHLHKPKYDRLVLALGGDMVSGDIHEELRATNEEPIGPVLMDLSDNITWLIEQALKRFDSIYIPCVSGNHGRTTHKTPYKKRGPTNMDWLLYKMLEQRFTHLHPKVQFAIPDGPDMRYSIYKHTYLLTHGDQFRGGDGLIGPLGPLTRGRHKKQSRNQALDLGFDTMLCGHFHQLMMLFNLIVNGSLKGYDEFAWGNNFSFERASQAMWITHPEHGITFQMPVYVDEK